MTSCTGTSKIKGDILRDDMIGPAEETSYSSVPAQICDVQVLPNVT